MKLNEISPDEVTMVSVISACAHLEALLLRERNTSLCQQNGFDLDVYIGSALIDIYGK